MSTTEPGASLREHLDAAVRSAGGRANQGLDHDGTWSTVLPVGSDVLVPTTVRLALSGRYFTLVAPLAALDGPADAELLLSLLSRHADADRSDGAAYAIVSADSGDIVVATYHWLLPSISPDEFATVLQVFARAVRGLHEDLAELEAAGAPLAMLDDVWDA